MSIIPASRLSSSYLAQLGNNLVPSARPRRQRSPFDLKAINRSLAGHGERVGRLYGGRPNATTRASVAAS